MSLKLLLGHDTPVGRVLGDWSPGDFRFTEGSPPATADLGTGTVTVPVSGTRYRVYLDKAKLCP